MADPIMPFGFAEISDGEGNWHEDHNDNFQKVNDKLTPLVDLITAIADLDVLLYDTVTERMEKYQFGDIFSINVSSRRIDIKNPASTYGYPIFPRGDRLLAVSLRRCRPTCPVSEKAGISL